MSALDDVIVMNTHRVSESIGYGVYTGSYMRMAGPRFYSGTSKTVGDIAFLVNGQRITWGGIPDPTGLKNFIKLVKKTMYDPLIKLQITLEVESLVLTAVYRIQEIQNFVTYAEEHLRPFAQNVVSRIRLTLRIVISVDLRYNNPYKSS